MMELLRIDLRKIVKTRLSGWKGKLIPGFLFSPIEKLIHQDELNQMLETTYPAEGSAFADAIYDFLDLDISEEGLDRLPAGKRYIFASNHPLGGLDGIGLIKILGNWYGDDNIRVLVNDMLMNVEPLRKVFLPINKYGSQGRSAAKAINEAYASSRQIVMFPAGLVSRLHPDGEIKDLEWQKSFVAKAVEYDREIVPVWFEGLNRARFYKFARLRRKLNIGINLEQALLPGEVCASRGKKFRILFGSPVNPAQLKERGMSISEITAHIRALSDSLPETSRIINNK